LPRSSLSWFPGYSLLGVASLASFAFGVRSAWKYARQPEAADLRRAQVLSGVGFAGKALGVATLLTVSGFSLFIVGISWALKVNTPRQFGNAMREAFGDSLRLPQSQNSQTFEELVLSIEASTKAFIPSGLLDWYQSCLETVKR
uniref:Transmembrane protein 242 n=1 Tax=Heligmosomoides polygyrus TaxID=6339 RepID=A0A183G2M6_HELPZ